MFPKPLPLLNLDSGNPVRRVHPAVRDKTHELSSHLRVSIEGEVRFDEGSRALYATDASNYRQVPTGVVIPKSVEDVIQTVAACHRYEVPVLSRGGGTSLAGQCCNVAVVMDMSKYLHAILELDPSARRARVQPGLVLDVLRQAAEKHHLTFAPDPSTHDHCTLGGMIGNNSCGVHALMGGKTMENIEELDILTYDGLRMRVGTTSEEEAARIIARGDRQGKVYAKLQAIRDEYAPLIRSRFPDIPRRVSGYNLDQLLPEHGFHLARALVGTEGTCVTVLEATVRLIHSPPRRKLVVLGYPDIYRAGDHLLDILAHHPIGLEGLDEILVRDMTRNHLHVDNLALLPEGGGWLLVEFGGDTEDEADGRAQNLMEELQKQPHAPTMKIYDDPMQEQQVWIIRKSGLGATARVPGSDDNWTGWEDSAVHPKDVGNYLRDLRTLMSRYDYQCALYGHFGQGCIHTRINFDLKTQGGIQTYRNFVEEASDLVMQYRGSFSGEHGDGQSRGELLPKMFGAELMTAFREFKRAWDPDWKMNPGKVIDADPLDHHLRLGTPYDPPHPATHFHYPDDHFNFARATLRCVGVGDCRRMEGGTMCPSYRVTREEMHSTRGRAHLLFEMLQGDPLRNSWRNEHVKEALQLCLACKGCLHECPVNVDMATYKAEFLSHYYRGCLRPRAAYAMGLIYWWSRVASKFPTAVNTVTHAPLLGHLIKKIGGIAPQRDIPRFASQTFTTWFGQRRKPAPTGIPVLLWPDTFNNHFYPHVLQAAVNVLERVGFQVTIPSRPLCCGRPLYDFGMVPTAIRLLRQILQTLDTVIAEGMPVIGLEPSCVAVFRHELVNLLPHDEQAKRLSRLTMTLSEFLNRNLEDFAWPQLHRKALVHGHCHQKAVMGMAPDINLLNHMGLDCTFPDSGCCGMSGSFGFKAEHYSMSLSIGEQTLLPHIRGESNDTLVIADGFSCREQIAQTTGRHVKHISEIIEMGMSSHHTESLPTREDGPMDHHATRSIMNHGKRR
ncbi:MAG: FAD-binding and (Fe-S)-binding domain-containing protein [Nitrospirales bacterium]